MFRGAHELDILKHAAFDQLRLETREETRAPERYREPPRPPVPAHTLPKTVLP